MARTLNDDSIVDEASVVGHLTAALPQIDRTSTKIVRGATQRIVKAVSGSQGKQVHVVEINPPSLRDNDDWFPADEEVPFTGPQTGFATYEAERSGQDSLDYERYPIERQLDPIAEEKRILAAADRIAQAERVLQDPKTKLPSNWAATDRLSESDKFYGKDKQEAETTTVMERMKHIDRTKEKVNYDKAKVVPITFIGR